MALWPFGWTKTGGIELSIFTVSGSARLIRAEFLYLDGKSGNLIDGRDMCVRL